MAPKRKSKKKGDVLARMSVEQRRQYLERRAAQEQEKTRRREELLAAFLKLKLEDEKKKTTMNEAKLNVKWRSVLKETKTVSLRSQLKNLKLWTEETVSTQDKTIQLLISSLEEARLQRANASQKNLSVIHKLAALHEEHIALLTSDFRDQEMRFIQSSSSSIQGAARKHLFQMKRLELVYRAAQELKDREEQKESLAFENAVAAIKTKLMEEVALTAAIEEEHLQSAWWHLATTLKEFEDETNDVRNECEMMQSKVETNMATKDKIDQQIKEMQSELAMWKKRFAQDEPGNQSVSKDHEKTTVALQTLRESLKTQETCFRDAIKLSNRTANSAFESLNETIHIGEEILYLSELCGRQETIEDKNLPYRPLLSLQTTIFSAPPCSESRSDMPDTKESSAQVPPARDSGVGSSLKTSDMSDGTEYSTSKTDETHISPKVGAKMEALLPDPIPENPIQQLPRVTLERIKTLIKDEALLGEISAHSSKGLSHHPDPPSDYIIKESELLLRTNEAMSNLWRKLNNVQVQRLSLRKEASDLQQQNKHLKNSLRTYFLSQGISDAGFDLPKTPWPVTVTPLPSVKTDCRSFSRARRSVQMAAQSSEEKKENASCRHSEGVPIIEGKSVLKSVQMHQRQTKT